MLEGLKARIIQLLGGQYAPLPKKTVQATQKEEIHSLWDYLTLRDNTQAHHLISVIGFDELIAMEEIRRRIFEVFRVQYKNDRSLYPYLKTLVDIGLLETLDVGGKRKWRKKAVLLRKKKKKQDAEEAETLSEAVVARETN